MPRANTNKLYRTFAKGLITEAGYLTYPEDASFAEMNTILSRKGNRSRRLGIDFQDGYALNDLDAEGTHIVNEYVWGSVNNDPNVTFACVQVGSMVYFFKMNGEPLSGQIADFAIDLMTYKIPTAAPSDIPTEYAAFSGGMGFLFIAHRYMDPVSVEYKPETDTIVVIPIVIQIRDFEGVYDGLANDEEPATLSPQHHYNLRNQGWVAPGTKTVNVATPTYPTESGGSALPPGSVYYDPYTGDSKPYSGGGGIPPWKLPEREE